MTTKKITFTREGYEKLKQELDHLINVKRRELSQDIARARAFGDLKENAEYDAAKTAQGMNEKRIAELTSRLRNSQILDDSKIDKDKVFLGATVTLRDMYTDEISVYMLVSAEEADYRENKISVTSPIGKALLGHKRDTIVTINAPAGALEYKIIKIER